MRGTHCTHVFYLGTDKKYFALYICSIHSLHIFLYFKIMFKDVTICDKLVSQFARSHNYNFADCRHFTQCFCFSLNSKCVDIFSFFIAKLHSDVFAKFVNIYERCKCLFVKTMQTFFWMGS